MKMISTVSTELKWFSTVQFAPEEDCPVLILIVADDGFAVDIAEISPLDHEWRLCHDHSRLDPDDIEMWAEITVPKFNN